MTFVRGARMRGTRTGLDSAPAVDTQEEIDELAALFEKPEYEAATGTQSGAARD